MLASDGVHRDHFCIHHFSNDLPLEMRQVMVYESETYLMRLERLATTPMKISLLICLLILLDACCSLTQTLHAQPYPPEQSAWYRSGSEFDPYATTNQSTFGSTGVSGLGSPRRSFSETLFSRYRDVKGNCRQFPLAASLAVDRGIQLPLPFGLQGIYTYIDAEPTVIDVRVGFQGNSPVSVPASVPIINNKTQSYLARFDGWIFPFLNIYGLFGETSAEANGILSIPNPDPSLPDILTQLQTSTSGPTYGVGTTFVFGYRSWFVAADANSSRTQLELFDSDIKKKTASIRTGLRGPVGSAKVAVWIGAMYFDRKTQVDGTVLSGTLLDPIRFEIESEFKDEMNTLLGMNIEVLPSLNLTLEAGFGAWEQINAAIAYRL